MAFNKDLKSIFRMMTPGDLTGVRQNSLGNQDENYAHKVLRSLFDRNGGGAISVADMLSKLNDLQAGASPDALKEIHKHVRLYTTAGMLKAPNIDWQLLYRDDKNTKESVKLSSFEEVVAMNKEELGNKRMGVVLSNSRFINPSVRSAENAQLFMNYVPSMIMSRCVPYLSVEMSFDRPLSKGTELATPGLLKFLIGSQKTSALSNVDKLLVDGNKVRTNGFLGATEDRVHTIAGMEMFTTPQSLVNASPINEGARYVPVLDKFRPLASIESLTVNVTPTVGLYSYKKANLTMKIHDRSRLAEFADLIQPLVYTKTTVWLTYGWRHPREPGNPYADFINSTMMVREAYGISNSSFNFDKTGQVTVNLELYTKGIKELRDIRITGTGRNSFEGIKQRFRDISEQITALRRKLKLDKPTGLNKEIRAFQVLEAASSESWPDLDMKEIGAAISKLEKSFLRDDIAIDADAANQLKSSIREYYSLSAASSLPGKKAKEKKFRFDRDLENVSTAAVNKLFKEIQTGPDPFVVYEDKELKRQNQVSAADDKNQLASVYTSYNKLSSSKKKSQINRLVSFGKIFSTFLARAVATVNNIDELQIFFYTFNDRAGLASNRNIAEFPVDMSVFGAQLNEHILKRRSDKISVEEFLQVLVEGQLGDPRGPGYGLYANFEPFDPKDPDPKLTKKAEKDYESKLAQINDKRGPFRMPAIDVHVEATYVTPEGEQADLLQSFDRASEIDFGANVPRLYSRVLRVHVFDKQVDPYPLATAMLRSEDGGGSMLVSQYGLDQVTNEERQQVIERSTQNLPSSVRQKLFPDSKYGIVMPNAEGNYKIKQLVSQLVPSIIYGSEGSNIIDATVSSVQDSLLSSVQMLGNNAGRPSVTQPNGAGTGGLPLRVIPAKIDVTTQGCPIIQYAQLFFIDYNTGTTLDNIYGVTGLTHTITPGKFETQMNMTFYDAYGKYESATSLLKAFADLEIPE